MKFLFMRKFNLFLRDLNDSDRTEHRSASNVLTADGLFKRFATLIMSRPQWSSGGIDYRPEVFKQLGGPWSQVSTLVRRSTTPPISLPTHYTQTHAYSLPPTK